MPTKTGLVTSVSELLQELAKFAVETNGWDLMTPAVVTSTTREVILRGKGDGEDEIFIGMRVEPGGEGEYLLLNGYAGFDTNLAWDEQPGAIIYNYGRQPVVPLAADVSMTYWATADARALRFVVEMSNQYEAGYLGFMKPIAIDRQYPYPVVIGGCGLAGVRWYSHGVDHLAYYGSNGVNGAPGLCLRRPDGVWENGGTNLKIWPTSTHPVDTFAVMQKDASDVDIEDHMLFPFLIYEESPTGVLGQLEGIYWLGNRCDLATGDSVIHEGVVYKIFNNIYNRDDDAYFALEWR